MAFAGVSLYGSLVPLNYQPTLLGDAVERFRALPWEVSAHNRVDFASNILLFVPIAFSWLAAFTVDRAGLVRRLIWMMVTCLLCFALSVSLEFAQIWFPPRTVSQNDIAAQAIGSLMGALLWLGVGQTVTHWLRNYGRATEQRQLLDWLLQAYALGLAIYSLLPFDLTIHPADIYRKVRNGQVVLVPFENGVPTLASVGAFLVNVALFLPIGLLAARFGNVHRRRFRSVAESTLLGACAVIGLEIFQLFVYSRFTKTSDVVAGTVGAYFGARWAQRWNCPQGVGDNAGRWSDSRLLRAGAATLYSVLLCGWFWWPMHVDPNGGRVRDRAQQFVSVPFATLYRGSEVNAAKEVVRKTLLFAPLGVLLASMFPRRHDVTRRRVAACGSIAVCVTLGTFIELMQSLFPPHVPDITDVFIYTFGAATGMAIHGRWLRSHPVL